MADTNLPNAAAELAHHESNSRLSCQVEVTPSLEGLRVTIAPDE